MTSRSDRVLSRDKRKYLLKSERVWGVETHAYMPELCDQLDTGRVTRRDFVRQACLLGVSTGIAYGLADSIEGARPFAPALASSPKPGGTLRVAMDVQEMSDPATFPWVQRSNVARFIVEHLTRTRADNITVPYLAESWEASDDLTQWVFKLRQGVTWSNGDRFTSQDVAHTMARWLDPEVGSSNLGLFAALVEEYDTGRKDANGAPVLGKRGIANAVEVLDDYTIKLNLRSPTLAMAENFYNYPTAIVHRGFGEEYEADLSKHPIGTGPCALTEFVERERAVLTKIGDWWGGAFYLDRIEYIDTGDDTSAAVEALISKQVDMVWRLPVEAVETVERAEGLELAPVTTAQTAVMRFRVTEQPFDNKRLRQAVAACMDHQAILDTAFQGSGVVAENHHVCPIHPEYAILPRLRRDIELSKRLLIQAGYPDGVTLDLAVGDTDGPWMTAACLAFKEQCAPAGITVNVQTMPSSAYWEVWDSAPWGFTAWTHRPLGTMVLSLAYRAGVPWNECAYDNPEFDRALDAAEAELDVDERRKKVEVCQTMLQEDAIIPQPFWRKVFKAHASRVNGHQTHPTLYHQFQNVWLDDV